jgi:hypothetical protein
MTDMMMMMMMITIKRYKLNKPYKQIHILFVAIAIAAYKRRKQNLSNGIRLAANLT